MDFSKLPSVECSSDERYGMLLLDCYAYAVDNLHHPTTHTAALLVRGGEIVLRGRNELPRGVLAKEYRLQGENRHIYPNHAERDVLYRAAKEGIATLGLTLVVPWVPCITCANAIISCGISEVILHKQVIELEQDEKLEGFIESLHLLLEAGVKIVAFDGVLGVSVYCGKKHVLV